MAPKDLIDDLDRPEDEDFRDEHGNTVDDDEKISDDDFSRGGKGGSDKGDAARRAAEEEEAREEAAREARKQQKGGEKGAKDDKEEEETEEDDKIPLAAHLAERRRWEAKEQQLRKEIEDAKKTPEPVKEPEKAPDYATDPKGYIDFQTKKLAEQAENAGKNATQLAEEAKAQGEFQAFMNDLTAKEAAFRTQHADYDAALAHVRTIRAEQILLANPTATEAEVIQAIRMEEVSSAQALAKRGQNPIEYVYRFAKTVGYAPKAPDPAEGKGKKKDERAAGPDLSLSDSAGIPADDDEDEGDDTSVFEEALAERFGRRR